MHLCWPGVFFAGFHLRYRELCLDILTCVSVTVFDNHLEIMQGLRWCFLPGRILGLLLLGAREALASWGRLALVLVTEVFEAGLRVPEGCQPVASLA